MQMVRLGCVKYLNTLPLIEGLVDCLDTELVEAVPAHLIDLLLQDRIDLGLISVIDAARSPVPLALLPVGMIGCDGPTLTVRLFSSVPIDRLTTVCADTDSHTSVALMQVLLDRMYGLRPRIVDFDARERMMIGDRGDERGAKAEKARPEAMLLIGDKVATDPPPSDAYPHQLDLGQAWKEITGMPFVYAMWMCRAAEAGSQKIRTAAALLDRQRRHNRTRLDWLVESRAPDRGWASEVARTYAGSLLRYEVGDAERGAVARFLEDAATLGLCPRRALIWAE